MQMPGPKILKDLMMLRATLQHYHPLVIEGHTRDSRDASTVASSMIVNLKNHWKDHNMTKPIMLVSQGDPLTERGISAITRNVAMGLGVKRCLVCLDDYIDAGHSVTADRQDVVYEMKYSQMVDILNEHDEHKFRMLTDAVDLEISRKNEQRLNIGKEPLAEWYKTYAMLQEVTKGAIKLVAGDLTLAHTVAEITDFSVTSFYSVGIDLGLVHEDDVLPFSDVGNYMIDME